MTRFFTAAALAATLATSAAAGSLNDPVVDGDVVMADAAANSSSNGMPLVLLVLTAMVIAASD